ncbi:MAG: sulfotransferase domain-containing protein [Longimicrobiales bacterium]
MLRTKLGPLFAARLPFTRAYSRGRLLLLGRRYEQLVVCGYPRGGTSLLYNMLSATLPNFRFEEFEEPAIYRLHRLGNIASKYPLDVFNVSRLPDLNVHGKKLHVIAMLRDPRDVVTSRHPLLPDRYFIGHDNSWWPQDTEFREWKYNAPGVVDIFDELERLRGQSELHVEFVRYEDLVEDSDAVQARLADRLGLSFGGRFSDFYKHPGRMAYRYDGRMAPREASLVREDKPADRSRSGKWQGPEHRERILEQFRECPRLFELLRLHGYENDDGWLARI